MANGLYQKDVSSPIYPRETQTAEANVVVATAYHIRSRRPQSLRRQQHRLRKYHLSEVLLQLQLAIVHQQRL
jgi:hypothetical protein